MLHFLRILLKKKFISPLHFNSTVYLRQTSHWKGVCVLRGCTSCHKGLAAIPGSSKKEASDRLYGFEIIAAKMGFLFFFSCPRLRQRRQCISKSCSPITFIIIIIEQRSEGLRQQQQYIRTLRPFFRRCHKSAVCLSTTRRIYPPKSGLAPRTALVSQ